MGKMKHPNPSQLIFVEKSRNRKCEISNKTLVISHQVKGVYWLRKSTDTT